MRQKPIVPRGSSIDGVSMIRQNKNTLKKNKGRPISLLEYPYNDFSSSRADNIREISYRFIRRYGPFKPGKTFHFRNQERTHAGDVVKLPTGQYDGKVARIGHLLNILIIQRHKAKYSVYIPSQTYTAFYHGIWMVYDFYDDLAQRTDNYITMTTYTAKKRSITKLHKALIKGDKYDAKQEQYNGRKRRNLHTKNSNTSRA